MRVLELWRYPVKSLQGERLPSARIEPQGIAGDRRWALFDVVTGLGLTARRVPELLFAAARLRSGSGVEVVLPDGTVTDDDDLLSAWLGRRVALRSAATLPGAPTYESPDDDEHEAAGGWHTWRGAGGAFHDDADARLSLVSTGTIEGWDRRRFRANVLLDGSGEDALVGRRIRIGSVVLEVGGGIRRCVMVTRPQPEAIERDLSVLRTIHRERAGLLAVWARVVGTGALAVGDELHGDAA